jgi:putative endonuclease
MLNLFQHPSCVTFRPMRQERQPCVYILASQPRGTLYIGVTSDLIESENPDWHDLAVGLGLPPVELR